MSVGSPSNLGTVLVQRLDTVLGTTLGQQSNIASGAGPQAIPQPGNTENPSVLQNPAHKHPREAVDQAGSQGQQRAAIGKASREMLLDNLLGRANTLHSATQSAPTTLGYAARTILALLNHYPQAQATITGQRPLINPGNPGANTSPQAGASAQNPAQGAPAREAAQPSGAARVWAQLATNLNQPGALAARFNQALGQSVQNSGLFYEAHLAQLSSGKTTPAAMRQEPQGQIPTPAAQNTASTPNQAPANAPPPAPAQAAAQNTAQAGSDSIHNSLFRPQTAQAQTSGGAPGAGADLRPANPGQPPGTNQPAANQNAATNAGQYQQNAGPNPAQSQLQQIVMQQMQEGAAHARAQASEPGAGSAKQNHSTLHQLPIPGIDPQAQGLVRQQLEVLANQSFVWQGEAWPGAEMHWEVQRHGEHDPGQEQLEHWSTSLLLRLPILGDVQARLSLAGDQLVMRITAPTSAARLHGALEPLRARLLAQGLQASQISVMATDTEASEIPNQDNQPADEVPTW